MHLHALHWSLTYSRDLISVYTKGNNWENFYGKHAGCLKKYTRFNSFLWKLLCKLRFIILKPFKYNSRKVRLSENFFFFYVLINFYFFYFTRLCLFCDYRGWILIIKIPSAQLPKTKNVNINVWILMGCRLHWRVPTAK